MIYSWVVVWIFNESFCDHSVNAVILAVMVDYPIFSTQ